MAASNIATKWLTRAGPAETLPASLVRLGWRCTGFDASSLARVTACLTLLVVVGCGQSESAGSGADKTRPVMSVEIQPANAEQVVVQVNAIGTLLANESVVLRSEIAGRIEQIAFGEGQPVTDGDLLMTLNQDEQQALVEQTAATVALAELSFARARDMLRSAMISQQEFDEAEARLRESRAALRRNRVVLEKTRLMAPFSGIVGLRHVSPGAYIRPGQDLVNLEDIDPIKVEFRVSERYGPVIAAGQEIRLSVDAVPGRTFGGAIYAINPQLDPRTRAYALRARVPNADGLLRPGMFARVVLIVERRENAVTVAEEAIWPQGDGVFVYRVQQGRANLIPVALGERFDGKVEIRQGLAAGDRVVTAGQMKIRDGMAVADMRHGQGDMPAGALP